MKPKRLMFAHVAALAQVFANPVRVELVDLLAQAPRSVEALAALAGQSHANVSQHLQHMRGAGVVTATRHGKAQIYALADDMLTPFYLHLSAVADRVLAEAQRTRAERYAPLDPEPPLPLDQLEVALTAPRTMLIDVRPAPEYAHDHIPGALSLPVANLPQRLEDAPPDRAIITYCRGPHCTYAYEAVGLLRAAGRHATRLEGGYLAWRASQIGWRSRPAPHA